MTHRYAMLAVVRPLPALPGVLPPRMSIVTSDAPLAAVLNEVLRRRGYDVRVLAAVDLASLNAFLPRVVVVDTSRLSKRDMSALRAVDRPLLALSPSPDDADIARELGARSFWPLPLDIERFLTAVAAAGRFEQTGPRLVFSRQERRAQTRPRAGDVKPCSHCSATMRFLEMPVTGAAWVCGNPECLVVTFVRANH